MGGHSPPSSFQFVQNLQEEIFKFEKRYISIRYIKLVIIKFGKICKSISLNVFV